MAVRAGGSQRVAVAKRAYSDDDKALVLATLAANGGNVKRTARDTTIPEQTVRDWKKQADRGATPASVTSALPAALDQFVSDAERVRNLALALLESKILLGDIRAGELNAVIGTLTDKINLARGQATSRQEQVRTTSPEEFGPALKEWLERTALAAQEREADIVDAEYEEQALGALPAASDI